MTNCCSFGSWNCDVFMIMSPYHTLTNCHANGVHVDAGSSKPYAAFRLAPHIIIPGVGPALCNCHATIVDGGGGAVAQNAVYQLYENDSPQTYSIVNCYLSARKRLTNTKPRNVHDPDDPTCSRALLLMPAGGEDAWQLIDRCEERAAGEEGEVDIVAAQVAAGQVVSE